MARIPIWEISRFQGLGLSRVWSIAVKGLDHWLMGPVDLIGWWVWNPREIGLIPFLVSFICYLDCKIVEIFLTIGRLDLFFLIYWEYGFWSLKELIGKKGFDISGHIGPLTSCNLFVFLIRSFTYWGQVLNWGGFGLFFMIYQRR